jgi:type IV pilus assembly protein PilM
VVKKEASTVLGVDVGSSSIKVVQLHNNRGVATLDTYGELQLGPYGGVEIGRTTNLQAGKLAEAFADIIRESAATSTEVAFAVSYNASFMTSVTLQVRDDSEIAALMPVEARKYVPVALSEVSLDWFAHPVRRGEKDRKIFLVAIHNNALNKYDLMIQATELNKRSTEIEIFSLIRSSVSQHDDTVALIDLGASSTKLYIAQQGLISKTHSLRMGGSELTSNLASALEQDFKTSEELKRNVGLHGVEGEPKVQKTMAATLERGFREIHKAIVRHAEEDGLKIDKVILSGGGAMLKGIDVYAADMLSMPVEVADPFSKVAYPAFLEDTLKDAGPTFGVAIGAALQVLIAPE